jgi:DNA polymerase-3 subunit beta
MFVASNNEGHCEMILDGNKLTITAESAGEYSATASMDIEYGGERYEFAMNGRYLLDVLRVAQTKKINWMLLAPEKPVVLKTENDEFYNVIMPRITKKSGT